MWTVTDKAAERGDEITCKQTLSIDEIISIEKLHPSFRYCSIPRYAERKIKELHYHFR